MKLSAGVSYSLSLKVKSTRTERSGWQISLGCHSLPIPHNQQIDVCDFNVSSERGSRGARPADCHVVKHTLLYYKATAINKAASVRFG